MIRGTELPRGCFGSALLAFYHGLADDREQAFVQNNDDLKLTDFKIVTKESEFVSFVPNTVQQKYIKILDPNWDGESVPTLPPGIRELILKGRQFGFSTLIDLLIFATAMTTPNTNAVVIGHDKESTEKLFRAVRRAYDNLPESKRASTKYSNKRELLWGDINSTFYVGTAGAKDFGRSSTIHFLHCTEVSKWSDAQTLMTGLAQAVPENGRVWLETTANGFGDYFCTEYSKAKSGKSSYTARFFPWFEHAEYRRDPSRSPVTASDEEEEEAALRAAYNLDEWQLAWRRWKRSEPGMADKFVQEYPSNDDEAFVSSGSPYFNAQRLNLIAHELKPYVKPDGYADRLRPGSKLRRAFDLGEFRVYRWPIEGRQYVIGADTAEGLTGAGDHDFDAADVLDADGWEQVATVTGKWDTHEYGILLAELGTFYNTALVAPERNNHGHAVINALIHSARYPEQRPRWPFGLYLHEEYDSERKLDTDAARPGWPSTVRTKYFALDLLASTILDGSIVINDQETLAQLRNFNKLPGGKAGGASGTHDDKVMSLSIAAAVLHGREKPINHGPAAGFAFKPRPKKGYDPLDEL